MQEALMTSIIFAIAPSRKAGRWRAEQECSIEPDLKLTGADGGVVFFFHLQR